MTEMPTYTAQLDQAIERLHAEGRYDNLFSAIFLMPRFEMQCTPH